ncbi:competence/damage-inducible protein A [Candidatus Sulfidibacterium hydrothermale]|jgi:nicotinamide-nucleotide amidase|uniref:competence/damage-inducible protein A n=1 Tax=Candidatus Sulfidibacterium hydrothermale TaxID=2875962 RepID=UPI001F0A426D|nr:competence/damage-inducible protein A [Candidatus Sulfidibacterium hydrothermale]UBM62390.1 competence/damage-inducible protein A [Candidatus Sulfidibacterium hydrothermale]
MKAEIINIGDELLIGQVVNTNASWMAEQLTKAGFSVVQITTIADDATAIKTAIDGAFQRADAVLISGGLGPTKDDITKKTLAEYFNAKMVFHEPTFEQVKKIFAARNFPVTEINRQQALIPDNCTPLFNKNGTAPGMWFEKNGKVAVSMPGVPFEMKAMMEEQVIPKLLQHFQLGHIVFQTVMTTGMPESMLAEKIKTWEENLPDHIHLAYLPQPGIVRLRLTAKGEDKEKLTAEINAEVAKLKKIIPEIIYGYNDVLLEEVTGNLLRSKGKTVSTAESCTGGYIAHLITSIAGSSDYFEGSVVSYSNRIKTEVLGVKPQTLEKYGAVSREVVLEMAEGVRRKLKTDYSIAVSGIAGPTGGTPEKPVGTVWIAVSGPEGSEAQLFHFGEHRGRNIRRSALAALNMLRLKLI